MVISALLILSALTLSITAQLMAPVFAATSATQHINSTNDLRSALQVLRPIIKLASNAGAETHPNLPKLDGAIFTLQVNGNDASFILQDVNGLVDVNSASHDLLTAFLQAIGRPDRLADILAHRTTQAFRSIDEFRVFLGGEQVANLERLLTVNAGRRRINGQTAPLALLRLLAGQSGNRAQLTAMIDRRFLHTRPITDVLVFPAQ